MSLVTLADVERARVAIRGVVHHTPLTPSATFSDLSGAEVALKLENLQRTGSFKIRGAYNKIATLSPGERAKGVVAASAGNHAQGVALAARLAGIPATIVMPKNAPISKAAAVRGYGAKLVPHGVDYAEAEEKAFEIQKETGATFVHAFNDPAVIAGQGTLGLEILDDMPDVETVVVPIGGGGLASGVGAAIKAKRPDVRVVGVVPEGAASLPESLKKGAIVTLDRVQTIADGLATRKVGSLTFDHIRKHVDDVAVVGDDETAKAILLLLERAKTVVEGAGAVGLAAILSGRVKLDGRKTVVILSGGNIDVTLLDTIIQRGLVRTGRSLSLATVVDDKPGALRDLLGVLAALGANVEAIEHDRARLDVGVGRARVLVRLATRGPEHVEEILAALAAKGYATDADP
ncbi:MAG TPA: threonine ammonia-lyase [Candidatus Thermoplasmatota archaeon]|nr:threonine ammonia-lyase [Candidatus Thermoplasmatota archaeon]